ncbi:MAG: hypothetical protein IJ597_06420, partial [Synergistaceae bacterium]|nr:hypothetical protein [Synergistaceae bacterium]
MKRLISLAALILILTAPAFALSDSEYLEMKKTNKAFAEADKSLTEAYSKAKGTMPNSDFKN